MNASKSANFATESEVRIVWDSAPIQQAFGRRCIVADCVATLPDGRSYRGNVYGNAIGRRIEMTLRHTAGAKRGLALAESHMPLVRSAIQAAALELFHAFRVAQRFGETRPTLESLARRIEAARETGNGPAARPAAEPEAAPAVDPVDVANPLRRVIRVNVGRQREGIAAIAEAEQAPAVAAQREVIRLEMNWSGAAGIIAAALENGTGAGKRAAREELARMAELADERNRLARATAAALEALDSNQSPHARLAAIRAALSI